MNGKKIIRLWTTFGKKAACVEPLRSRTRTLRKYSGVHLLHADNRHMQRQLHGCGIRRAEKPAQDSMSGTFRMTYFNWRETHSEYSDYMLGWGNRTKDKDGQASSYVTLATDVLEGKWDTYVEAKKYTLLANSFTDTAKK